MEEKLSLTRMETELDVLRKKKWLYFSGKMSQDELVQKVDENGDGKTDYVMDNKEVNNNSQIQTEADDIIDFTDLKLKEIPKQININIFFINLKHLFISNNNLSNNIDFRNFVNLETLDIDNNNIEYINIPDKLKELSICNNKLKTLNCKKLLRLKCSNNLLENIILSSELEIIEIDNNKIQILNLTNLKLI